ncbi:MerR family transcriptional regulator [Christensenellaceae bacterium OttesenSCG-928-M15]|nr:MerR family transcriptional regulator [Christensenellaceae bacterium OttesenSCG-928-M15]
MEYSILELANIAGVSTRTLRYYDQIGLLRPKRTNSGYRAYGTEEVDLLQQILFYRELDMDLKTISKIIHANEFDIDNALVQHKREMNKRICRMRSLIEMIDKNLATRKEGKNMKDTEKFTAFKKDLVDENERKYGEEIRGKYGERTVDASNTKLMGMNEEEYTALEKLGAEILEKLKRAKQMGDPASKLAQEVCALHKKWICAYWTEYSEQAHYNLAVMYTEDERFKSYYDKEEAGSAEFLKNALKIYLHQ